MGFALHVCMPLQTGVGCVVSATLKMMLHFDLQSMRRSPANSGVYKALDYAQTGGNHSIEKTKQKRMAYVMLYIVIARRRIARQHMQQPSLDRRAWQHHEDDNAM